MRTSPDIAGHGNLRRRMFMTLAALAAYRLASAIPIAGVDVDKLLQVGVDMSGAWARLSIMAIGIVPWISALTLAELAVLVLPGAWTRRIRDGRHANPFALPIVAVALMFAAFQGYGVSVALQQIPGLVFATDLPFSLVASVTLACGTALTMILAQVIQRSGVGFGFWILLAALGVSEIIPNTLRLLAGVQQGYAALHIVLGLVGATLAAIVALVGLAMTRQQLGFNQMEPLIWPIQLAGLIVPWLAVIVSIAGGAFADSDRVQASLSLHQPIGLLMLAAAIVGFTLLYARRESSVGLWPPTAGILAVLAVGLVVEHTLVPTLLLTAGHLVIVTAVAYVVVTGLRQAGAFDRVEAPRGKLPGNIEADGS